MMTTKRVVGSVAMGMMFAGVGAACSSGAGSPVVCGAGTALREGQCVVAVDGGADDGSASADGATDGARGADSADARTDGGTQLPPDDCPVGVIAVNCSDTCAMGAGPCTDVSCNDHWFAADEPRLKLYGAGATLRTPNHPIPDPMCASACAANSRTDVVHPIYSMAFKVATADGGARVRSVRVGAPWVMNGPIDTYFATSCPPNNRNVTTGCAPITIAATIVVWTTDQNAPARNITVSDQPCP